MDVFQLRDQVIDDYSAYVQSFLPIRDPHIKACLEDELWSSTCKVGSWRGLATGSRCAVASTSMTGARSSDGGIYQRIAEVLTTGLPPSNR